MVIDGFEIHRQEDGTLFVDDSDWVGQKSAEWAFGNKDRNDCEFWEKFWDKFCDKRNKAVDAAIAKWAQQNGH